MHSNSLPDSKRIRYWKYNKVVKAATPWISAFVQGLLLRAKPTQKFPFLMHLKTGEIFAVPGKNYVISQDELLAREIKLKEKNDLKLQEDINKLEQEFNAASYELEKNKPLNQNEEKDPNELKITFQAAFDHQKEILLTNNAREYEAQLKALRSKLDKNPILDNKGNGYEVFVFTYENDTNATGGIHEALAITRKWQEDILSGNVVGGGIEIGEGGKVILNDFVTFSLTAQQPAICWHPLLYDYVSAEFKQNPFDLPASINNVTDLIKRRMPQEIAEEILKCFLKTLNGNLNNIENPYEYIKDFEKYDRIQYLYRYEVNEKLVPPEIKDKIQKNYFVSEQLESFFNEAKSNEKKNNVVDRLASNFLSFFNQNFQPSLPVNIKNMLNETDKEFEKTPLYLSMFKLPQSFDFVIWLINYGAKYHKNTEFKDSIKYFVIDLMSFLKESLYNDWNIDKLFVSKIALISDKQLREQIKRELELNDIKFIKVQIVKKALWDGNLELLKKIEEIDPDIIKEAINNSVQSGNNPLIITIGNLIKFIPFYHNENFDMGGFNLIEQVKLFEMIEWLLERQADVTLMNANSNVNFIAQLKVLLKSSLKKADMMALSKILSPPCIEYINYFFPKKNLTSLLEVKLTNEQLEKKLDEIHEILENEDTILNALKANDFSSLKKLGENKDNDRIIKSYLSHEDILQRNLLISNMESLRNLYFKEKVDFKQAGESLDFIKWLIEKGASLKGLSKQGESFQTLLMSILKNLMQKLDYINIQKIIKDPFVKHLIFPTFIEEITKLFENPSNSESLRQKILTIYEKIDISDFNSENYRAILSLFHELPIISKINERSKKDFGTEPNSNFLELSSREGECVSTQFLQELRDQKNQNEITLTLSLAPTREENVVINIAKRGNKIIFTAVNEQDEIAKKLVAYVNEEFDRISFCGPDQDKGFKYSEEIREDINKKIPRPSRR